MMAALDQPHSWNGATVGFDADTTIVSVNYIQTPGNTCNYRVVCSWQDYDLTHCTLPLYRHFVRFSEFRMYLLRKLTPSVFSILDGMVTAYCILKHPCGQHHDFTLLGALFGNNTFGCISTDVLGCLYAEYIAGCIPQIVKLEYAPTNVFLVVKDVEFGSAVFDILKQVVFGMLLPNPKNIRVTQVLDGVLPFIARDSYIDEMRAMRDIREYLMNETIRDGLASFASCCVRRFMGSIMRNETEFHRFSRFIKYGLCVTG